jgi:hypothetical protein
VSQGLEIENRDKKYQKRISLSGVCCIEAGELDVLREKGILSAFGNT